MEAIRYTCTKLINSNKQGILKCDADGYYEIVIGGLNVFNSVGEYYTLKGAQELFDASSILMRRIKSGTLSSEYEHPKRMPGMSLDDYIRRILTIDRKFICAHIKEVRLDLDYGKNHPELNNSQAVAIIGLVKPTGPYGDHLENSLKNKCENVCFSIRALTKDYIHRGQTYRVLNIISTWDCVNEPGISSANKYDTPSLESIYDQTITIPQLERIVESDRISSVATESSELAFFALKKLKENQNKSIIYNEW